MDQALWITLWVSSGAFLGGVVTPVITSAKKGSGWLMMVLGLVMGAVGHVLLLVPLWGLLITQLKNDSDARLDWQRDMLSRDDIEAALATPEALDPQVALGWLASNFWPKTRPAGEHSHRMTYVGVFVALAVITAIEVMLSLADSPAVVGPLVALSSAKVLLVVMYFMHLRYDSKWYAGVFAVAMPFAALVMIVLAVG